MAIENACKCERSDYHNNNYDEHFPSCGHALSLPDIGTLIAAVCPMGSVHPPDVSTWHLSTSILGHLYHERENCSEPLFMFDCSLHDDNDGA